MNTIRNRVRTAAQGLLCCALATLPALASAADTGSRKGHGHVFVGYQYIKVDGFESSIGTLPIGTTDTHSLNFDVEYFVTDKLSVTVGLPLVRKRYQGGGPHDPLTLDPPRPDVKNIDDGKYRTNFQDFHIGARYIVKEGPLMIEPYVFLGVPSNNYEFFGHAAVGQNLNRVNIGSTFSYRPPLSDAWYELAVGYEFVEETLGVNIDHWRINGEVGYAFADNFAARAFFILKDGGGEVFPDDFPPPRNDERWFQHDRMVKHNFANAGIAVDWKLNDRYDVTASWLTMVWEEQVHIVDYSYSVGFSWSF